MGWGRRGKDDKKQNTLSPLLATMAKPLSATHREDREVAIIAVLADRGLGDTETTPTTTKSIVFFKNLYLMPSTYRL